MKGNACSVSYVSQPQLCVAGKGFTAYCQTSSATAAAPCHPSHLARATSPSSLEASQCLDPSFGSEAQPHNIFINTSQHIHQTPSPTWIPPKPCST